MRRILRHMICLSVIVVSAILFAEGAQAAPTITRVLATDVTPSGFSVIWQTSEPAGAGISVYSDPNGTIEITTNYEITYYPVHSGNPNSVGNYEKSLDKDAMTAATRALGLVKVSVNGCKPATTYYFKVRAEAGAETVVWPKAIPASVTTAVENSFVGEAKHLLLMLNNGASSLNASGWLVTAASDGTRTPICEFVGDGVGTNQVYLNLSRMFAVNGYNWTPEPSRKTIEIQMLGPGGSLLNQTVTVDFSGTFSVAAIDLLGINIASSVDGRQVTLADVILALQVLVRMHPSPGIRSVVDIDGNGRIGIAEVINALQILVELRR
jgi:hypothetical protein